MATKRKPLSADEKKETLLRLLHDTCEVFNKAELEKRGAAAGVVEKTVMENVAALVADRKVETDKLGAGVFFWSFPSATFAAVAARVDALEAAVAAAAAARAAAEARIAELTADAGAAAARAAALAELATLQARARELEAAVKAQAASDPDVARAALTKVKTAKAGADRWTDALLAIKGLLIKKYNVDAAQASAMLGMDDKFDYAA